MEGGLEKRITHEDLDKLKRAFMRGRGHSKIKLCLSKEQFCKALSRRLTIGSKDEYADLFEKIDVTRQGLIDWDRFSEHMLLGMYEKDKRVPNWRKPVYMKSHHKHSIQGTVFVKTTRRYLVISKEGNVSIWDTDLKLYRSLRVHTDSCKPRDIWVTCFVAMENVNKAAIAMTNKEIALYDLSSKSEFSCQYKVCGLPFTPLCLDYRYNPSEPNEACLVFGDVGGFVHVISFNSALTTLFERPPVPVGEDREAIVKVHIDELSKNKSRTAAYTKYLAHEKSWVRHVKYSRYLECFISCTTHTKRSLVIGWMEKRHVFSNQPDESAPLKKEILRYSIFSTQDGVNTFDYSKRLNLIATAGINHNVCLWNPYVASRPNGVLQGHTASILQVQFIRHRGQLLSLALNKVVRIWDVHLQTCICQLAGKFPKSPEAYSTLYFDEGKDRSGLERNRLFVSFNEKLMMMQMKQENKDKVLSHDEPVVAAIFNSVYNQVISVCQGGTMIMWMIETGQKVKQYTGCHGKSEITSLLQDTSQTRIFTGSTDGTVKIWDHNGICFHTLNCSDGHAAEVGQVVILKRSVIVLGWLKTITVFRNEDIERSSKVSPCEWKGGKEHSEDILFGAFQPPYTLATASYDGEIVIWNTNSEASSRHMTQRMTTHTKDSQHKANNNESDYTLSNSKLLFLDARRGSAVVGGSNLVSCGGTGHVRFWNSNYGTLIAEFSAHSGSITMATDKKNRYLVTGDVEGYVKVWEIQDYAIKPSKELITEKPALMSSFQPHSDMINTLEICEKNRDILIISASADCSVALWDIHGRKVGVFGQDELWILDSYKATEKSPKRVQFQQSFDDKADLTFVTEQDQIQQDDDPKSAIQTETVDAVENAVDANDNTLTPDNLATQNPTAYRFDAWGTTVLGKEYQEVRRNKRERKQPGVIRGWTYLSKRRTNRTIIGLYSALEMRSLTMVDMPTKPDADDYFYDSEQKELTKISKLPALADNYRENFGQEPVNKTRKVEENYYMKLPSVSPFELDQSYILLHRNGIKYVDVLNPIHMKKTYLSLKTAFDERSLFPGYIREYEMRMKSLHQQMTSPPKMGSKRPKTSLQNIGMQLGAQLQMDHNKGPPATSLIRKKVGLRPKTTGSISSKGSSN